MKESQIPLLFSSDLEAKDLILNVAQGSPREEISNSPQERHSPLQSHCRPINSQQKYHQPRNTAPTAIVTPPSSSLAEDEFTDSNGAVVYPPPDYPVFLSTFGNEEGYYHQFYQFSEQDAVTQHPPVGQQRPFSASSSSCSSDSEYTQQNFHLQANPYYNSIHGHAHHGHHFSNASFFGNATNVVPGHETVYGHEQPGSTGSAGYTSVIVDAQQYQLTNEYVR